MHNYLEVPATEYIKEDITEYMKKEEIATPKEAVIRLLELLPSAYAEELSGSIAVKAWAALQMLNQSSLAYHKSVELGEFIYDTKMFKLQLDCNLHMLHYLSSCELEPVLPLGLKSCRKMFYGRVLPENFTLGDNFDTSHIEDMSSMFDSCELPKGFTLGDKFDTSSVTDMDRMFSFAELPSDFTLGDKFDTSNVTVMTDMFEGCVLPEGFTLGDKFDTSNVTDMQGMFYKCVVPEGFTLGDKFNTSKVSNMCTMFRQSVLPKGFTLGKEFDTSNVTSMTCMFFRCTLPEGFTLGDHFVVSGCARGMLDTFTTCILGGEVLEGDSEEILQRLGGILLKPNGLEEWLNA